MALLFAACHARRTASSRRRRGWAWAFALTVLCTLGGVSAPAATAATSDGRFGINPGDLFTLPPSQWDAHLAAMRAAGIETVRMGAWWSDVEPGPPISGRHQYSWGDLDLRVAALVRHGLRWDPLLNFSPGWGSKVPGDYDAAPANNDDFAAFGAALARRYGRGGSFWAEHPELPALPIRSYEIWNEPNSSKYWHPGDAASYADLYAAARSAVHEVDDAARVLVGGLAATHNGATPAAVFLRDMFAHRPDLRGTIDAVAFHPYARDVAGVYAAAASLRRSLDAIAGPGVPLVATEIGWTTADTPEAQRAANLAEVALTLPRSDCGIDAVMAYAWLGPERDAGDREQWFGIVDTNAMPRPTAVAYASAIKQVRGISGAAGAGTSAICSRGPQLRGASTQPRGTRKPWLRVRLRQLEAPGRLLVSARCTGGCRLSAQLVKPVRGSTASIHPSRLKARHRLVLRHHSYRRGTRMKVRITVTRRGGHVASRSRSLRLR